MARDANTPRKTLAGGVACLAGGDTLIVAAGTYERGIYNPPAGTAAAYTTIRAAEGARPRIVRRPFSRPLSDPPPQAYFDRGFECMGRACAYIEIRGFEFEGLYESVKLIGSPAAGYAHHLRFIDNVFHVGDLKIASSPRGFEGGDHLIKGNLFYEIGSDVPGYGPGVNTIYNPGNRSIVEGNTFHNCTHGIAIWNQNGNHIGGVIIRGNRFHDMGRHDVDPWQTNGLPRAIHISVPGGGHQIYNNLFYRNGPPPSSSARFVAIQVATQADSTSTTLIYNNTFYEFYNSQSSPISVGSKVPAATVTVRNNIFFRAGAIQGGVTQSHNLQVDPMFVNAAAGDFRLKPGSPAIDKGTPLSPVVTTDFNAVARPQQGIYDMGAYEFVNSSNDTTPGAPTQFEVR